MYQLQSTKVRISQGNTIKDKRMPGSSELMLQVQTFACVDVYELSCDITSDIPLAKLNRLLGLVR